MSKAYQKPHNSKSGFIVSELMAMAVVLLSVVGIAAASKAGFDAFQDYELQAGMIEQESLIVSALQTESSLLALRSELRSTGVAAGAPLTYDGRVLARQGQSVKFGKSTDPLVEGFVECPDGQTNCVQKFSVELSILCQGAGQTRSCAAAYRLHARDNRIYFGSRPQATPNTWQPSDYEIPVPFEIVSRTFQETCGDDDLFVSGYNKTTGQLSCVSKPRRPPCGDNQIARTISYNSVENSMELDCEPLKTASCPSNYVLQRLNARTLHPLGGPVDGTCVFAALPSAAIPAIPTGASVAGTFCPDNYEISGMNCALVNQQFSNGTCWDPCPQTTSDGQPYMDYCPRTVAPNVGDRVGTPAAPRGYSCHVVYPSQQCGASWAAEVQVTGSCVLTLPVNSNATQGAP